MVTSRGPVSARVTAFWNVLGRRRARSPTRRSARKAIHSGQRATKSRRQAHAIASSRPGRCAALAASLRDNRVPQVPSYNAGLSARYSHQGWSASGLLRMTGPQFEDDLNAFTLRHATVVDVMGSRTVGRRVSLFLGIENLLDSEYDVGRTPILTTGLPRAARAGVQLTLP